jgi:hypothetical protein
MSALPLPFSFNVLSIADWWMPDDYGALEPSISGKIMELHHKMHHQTYVNSYNTASEQLAAAESKQDIQSIIALQPMINFHGGGHLNHTLFWENLAPRKKGGGGEPEGKLKVCFFLSSHCPTSTNCITLEGAEADETEK